VKVLEQKFKSFSKFSKFQNLISSIYCPLVIMASAQCLTGDLKCLFGVEFLGLGVKKLFQGLFVFKIFVPKMGNLIMRIIRNLIITWETNFMIKTLVRAGLFQKKNDLAHKNTSRPIYRAIKSKVNFRSIFR
jgi:hypothetical protein